MSEVTKERNQMSDASITLLIQTGKGKKVMKGERVKQQDREMSGEDNGDTNGRAQ